MISIHYYEIQLPFEHKTLDIGKVENIKHALENVDAVVSTLPYFLNKHIAKSHTEKEFIISI